jgi:hypothetical protein
LVPAAAPLELGAVLGADADEVFARLARAIQVAATPRGARPQPHRPRSAPDAATVIGVAQLVEALTSIQRGRVDARQLPGLGSITIDPTAGSALKQLRSTPMVSWSHPVDALTIDIVSMLFDAIFNDPDVPAAIRAEIAKLQIPVLKVALMDKAFFSNKKHPARRLMDVIANAAIGRGEGDEARLIEKIGKVVDEVVANFETDVTIFATQVARLEEFLADEETRARTRTEPVVNKLERHDRQQVAKQKVGQAISSRVHGQTVPTLVVEFLERHWRLVLIRAYVRGGEEKAPWVEAVRTMDELVWSVTPKHGAEERGRLLTALPDLLKRLRRGLESVDLDDAWDPFFAQLIRLHVGALHKDMPEDAYRPATPAPGDAPAGAQPTAESEPETGLRTLSLVESPSRIEYRIEPDAPEPAPKSEVRVPIDRHMSQAQSLDVGAWVEFESFRGTKKTLRLSWVSDFRGVYLFTNRQGENSLTLATTSLAEHLRKGTARVLSQERLTDRAVAQLLGKTGGPSGGPAARA